jgi:hypothetical protein
MLVSLKEDVLGVAGYCKLYIDFGGFSVSVLRKFHDSTAIFAIIFINYDNMNSSENTCMQVL